MQALTASALYLYFASGLAFAVARLLARRWERA
jgi:hypothetical protein